MGEATTPQELTATLFHQPASSSPGTAVTHITDETLAAFIATLQTLSPDPSQKIPHTTRYLDNPTHAHIASIAFTTALPISDLRHHETLQAFEQKHSLQVVLQATRTQQTPKQLAVFDMDSTIIQQEVIDLLAALAGVEPQVSKITARAMNGELDFTESLGERVALLRGLDGNVFETLQPSITLTPGAETLLRVLNRLGVRTALLSGGFTPLAEWVGRRLGMDFVHANELAVEDGKLTGRLVEGAMVVDSWTKERLLKEISEEVGAASEHAVLAVGDGANDLPMLWAAGLGVAVNAKPRVQVQAPARLNGNTALLDVLYLLGLTSDEIDGLAAER